MYFSECMHFPAAHLNTTLMFLHFYLLENLMDKRLSQVKKKTKLKAISVSTVGNEWSREARAATQSPNGTENLILIFVFA